MADTVKLDMDQIAMVAKLLEDMREIEGIIYSMNNDPGVRFAMLCARRGAETLEMPSSDLDFRAGMIEAVKATLLQQLGKLRWKLEQLGIEVVPGEER